MPKEVYQQCVYLKDGKCSITWPWEDAQCPCPEYDAIDEGIPRLLRSPKQASRGGKIIRQIDSILTWKRVLDWSILCCLLAVIASTILGGDLDYAQLIMLWAIALMIARNRYYPKR